MARRNASPSAQLKKSNQNRSRGWRPASGVASGNHRVALFEAVSFNPPSICRCFIFVARIYSTTLAIKIRRHTEWDESPSHQKLVRYFGQFCAPNLLSFHLRIIDGMQAGYAQEFLDNITFPGNAYGIRARTMALVHDMIFHDEMISSTCERHSPLSVQSWIATKSSWKKHRIYRTVQANPRREQKRCRS